MAPGARLGAAGLRERVVRVAGGVGGGAALEPPPPPQAVMTRLRAPITRKRRALKGVRGKAGRMGLLLIGSPSIGAVAWRGEARFQEEGWATPNCGILLLGRRL